MRKRLLLAGLSTLCLFSMAVPAISEQNKPITFVQRFHEYQQIHKDDVLMAGFWGGWWSYLFGKRKTDKPGTNTSTSTSTSTDTTTPCPSIFGHGSEKNCDAVMVDP